MTIFESEYPAVSTRGISVTEQLFRGLEGDPDRVVLTDGPTGREITAKSLKDSIQ